MKQGNIQILDLDFEYKLWKNRLDLYIHEIELLEDRINVLKREHVNLKMGEDKIDLLKIQRISIRELIKKIFILEQEISLYAEDYPIGETHTHFINHESIRNTIQKIFDRQHSIMTSVYPNLCYPIKINELFL